MVPFRLGTYSHRWVDRDPQGVTKPIRLGLYIRVSLSRWLDGSLVKPLMFVAKSRNIDAL